MAEQTSKKKVLITGAYGLIGNLVYAHLAGQPQRYDVYGTARRARPSQRAEVMDYHPIPEERLRIADLTDFEAMQRAVAGMDVVVHMAADASGQSWESILNNNITGSYHVFEACRLAGVKRIVYASSNQVAFGGFDFPAYRAVLAGEASREELPPFQQIDETQPARPMNLYACSKVFGEGLAHMYAHKHQLSCLVLRIGWVLSDDQIPNPVGRSLWLSQRDCIQAVALAINAPDSLRFDVFFVQSDNEDNFASIQHTKDVLGYAPQDKI